MYNLKYLAEYDTNAGVTCRVEIYKRDYEGIVYPLELTADPVQQSYSLDEPKPAIKACTLKLNIINAGSTPITDFYSERDDEYKIMHYYNGSVTFVGFLVQDDCSEEMADYRHTLSLSFTDNLGLLKDVALDANVPDFGYYPAAAQLEYIASGSDRNRVLLFNTDFFPEVSVPFTISGHKDSVTNTTWTPTVVNAIGNVFNNNFRVFVSPTVSTNAAWPVKISGDATINLYNRNTIANVLRVIFYNTGLELITNIYCNVFDEEQDTTYSPLYQTYIDCKTFLNNETFRSCWDVLEWICKRFNLTVFQAGGQWHIVRMDELRYGDVYGFSYNTEFDQIGTCIFNSALTFGFEQDHYPETAPTKSIERPFKYVQEKFDYKQPKYILRNNDWLELGPLLRSYSSGGNMVYEYEAKHWQAGGFVPNPDFFIRVKKDAAGVSEIERFLVIKGLTGDTARSVVGFPFEVSQDDSLLVEFNYTTTNSQSGSPSAEVILALALDTGTGILYADENQNINWKTGLGWNTPVPGDTNVLQSAKFDTKGVPADGLIYVYLPHMVSWTQPTNALDETHIKDLRVTYRTNINESAKIISHTHQSNQDPEIKNNENEQIYIDDSPRNSLAGTMFRPSIGLVTQDKTRRWFRLTNPLERVKLGQIITFETLFARRKPRAKIEGNFYGLNNLSLLAKVNYVPYTTLNFVFGLLEIDFRSNSFNCTLYELYETGEVDTDLVSDYEFTYLYSTD